MASKVFRDSEPNGRVLGHGIARPPESPPACRAVVLGEPVAKARPRCGRSGRPFTPTATVAAERAFAWAVKADNPGLEPLSGPLAVRLEFRCGDRRRRDLDNLVKLAWDSCNGVIWHDDSQVEALVARLVRGAADPRTEIAVWALDGEDDDDGR